MKKKQPLEVLAQVMAQMAMAQQAQYKPPAPWVLHEPTDPADIPVINAGEGSGLSGK